MLKIIKLCFKVVRRALVLLCAVPLAFLIDVFERNGLAHWPFVTEALGSVPLTFGWQLRQEVYRRLGVCRGSGIILNHGTSIGDRRTRIGTDVWMSRDVYVEYALVEDHVLVGPGAIILAGRHHHRADDVDVPIKLQGNNPLVPVHVGEGAWIGANATVMADVGAHAIVGAGAVVLKPVPAYAIVGGNPARFIRDRRSGGDALTAKSAAAATAKDARAASVGAATTQGE
ncbi:MAG TPA: acyltransferase [Pyrinomonadaceae bacterium]|nr:acyltransferase [Pyrinomonadaceae bacterium]